MNQQHFYADDSRIDPQTAQQLIARAAELQQQHLETVAPDQLEALAAEVGIRPEFVRRAMTEAADVPIATVKATRPRRRVRRTVEMVPLSAAQVRNAATPALLYAVYTLFVLLNFNRYSGGHRTAEMLFLFLQPVALSAYFGGRQPHRRMAAISGAAFAILPIIAAGMADGWNGAPAGVAFVAAPFYAAVAALACQLRRWLTERREQFDGEEAEA